MVSSSIEQSFAGMRGTSNQVTVPFSPTSKTIFLKRTWEKRLEFGEK